MDDRDLIAWALRQYPPGSRTIGSHAAARVLVALCTYANTERLAWPSAQTLADGMGGMTRRDVRNALSVLEGAQLIRPEVAPARGRVTRWRILAGSPAIPDTGDKAGYPASRTPVDNSPKLAGNMAGELAGDMAGYPAPKGREEKRTTNQSPAQPHDRARERPDAFELAQFRAECPDLHMVSDATIRQLVNETIGRARGEVRSETAYAIRAAKDPDWVSHALRVEWDQAVA